MIDGKSVLAIIPAREGSKRIPLKNLTMFRGKPLIQWAIDHARGSAYIDEIAISSDSEAILKYADQKSDKYIWKCERPAFLASDTATSEALIAHALYEYPCLEFPDYFVLLQPTSPLRLPSDIDECISRAHKFSGRCISWDQYGRRNGAVFVCRSQLFLASLQLEPKTGADYFTMPQERSLDIDYEQDFAYSADLKNAPQQNAT